MLYIIRRDKKSNAVETVDNADNRHEADEKVILLRSFDKGGKFSVSKNPAKNS